MVRGIYEEAGLARNPLKLNKFLMLAHMDVSSNCEVGVGPCGSWNTAPLPTHGDIRNAEVRSPSRRKSCSSPDQIRGGGQGHSLIKNH